MRKILAFLICSLSIFGAAQFSGNAWTTTVVTDGTKQTLINNIETALLNGSNGWTTVSGHGTTTLIMLSGTTPQSLQIRVRIKDNGGTNIQLYMENANSTLTPASYSTATGGTLQVANGLTYTVIASKYQFLIYTTTVGTSREFVWVGMPFLNTQLAANITAEGWMFSDGVSDTNAAVTGSIRNCPSVSVSNGASCGNTCSCSGNYELLLNSTYWEANNIGTSGPGNTIGAPRIVLDGVVSDLDQTAPSTTGFRWRTASPAIVTGDVFIAWGLTGTGVEALINGQVWDAVYINSSQPINTTSTFNGHDWTNLTNSNTGTALRMVSGGLWFATN